MKNIAFVIFAVILSFASCKTKDKEVTKCYKCNQNKHIIESVCEENGILIFNEGGSNYIKGMSLSDYISLMEESGATCSKVSQK